MDKLKPTRWTFVGTMANGEKIYNKSGSGLAIEKDKMYHVAPLPAEIIEIQKTKSHLRMTQGIVLGS